jgi:2-hydroxychromene-2-carboxylate isomerase
MPFLLGPIFARQGWETSPFVLYPRRGQYMWRDVERLCVRHGLEFRMPGEFPQFALLASRIAVAGSGESWLADFCKAIFHRQFGRGEDITGPEAVSAALEGLVETPSEWIGLANTPQIKQALKDRGALADRRKLFGAPSFVTSDGELFWGDDRLEQAIEWVLKRR